MQINISDDVVKELEYIIQLHQQHSAPNSFATVPQLVNFILGAIADGSRRPGSWEREMLDMMGLVAETPLHNQHRDRYGAPE